MDPFHFPSPSKPRVNHEVVLRRAQHVISPEAFSVELFQRFSWVASFARSMTTGWWFGTWLLFSHILGIIINPNWLSYFSGVLKPPTIQVCSTYAWACCSLTMPVPHPVSHNKPKAMIAVSVSKIVLLTCLCGSLPKHSTDRFASEFVTKIIPCLTNKHVSLSTKTLFFFKDVS